MTSLEARADRRSRSPKRQPSPAAKTPADVLEVLKSAGFRAIIGSFPAGGVAVFDHDLRYLWTGGLGLANVGLSP